MCKRARKTCPIIRSSSNFSGSNLASEESGVWWVAPPPSTASIAAVDGSIPEMLTSSAALCNKKVPRPRVLFHVVGSVQSVCESGSFYTSPNAPNVRTLNGHIDISLAKHPSRGHVAQWNFDMAVQRSDVRGVRAGVE